MSILGMALRHPVQFAIVLVVFTPGVAAQDRTVDPTWLHRDTRNLRDAPTPMASASCHYKPIFGEGDDQARALQNVARFGELVLDPNGSCQTISHDREEEIYFILQGAGSLHCGDDVATMKANDFTYVAPGLKHSFANDSATSLRVLVMAFRIPASVKIGEAPARLKIVNLDSVKEETVSGHPKSVLYRLLVGGRGERRDAIDEGLMITSFFLMEFEPGGTNFPHHHESAEEIYLVLDGEGEMVAGSGMDGVEGRFPASAGDAYYFRPNCTVGFYNKNSPGAKAHILAVRSKVFFPSDPD